LRAGRAAALAALLGLAFAAGCSDRRTVVIGFGEGPRTPIGFRCRDDQGRYLITRAVSERHLRFSLLVDFVGLGGGVPGCRAGDIAGFCESHTCEPLAVPARVCIPFDVPIDGENPLALIGTLLFGLEGNLVTGDAPHEPVIVRAVATAQPCEDVPGATALDPERIIGCAVSCPVQLTGVEGEVLLDLPTLSESCGGGVLACATGAFGQ
jgi:hypothetical protein